MKMTEDFFWQEEKWILDLLKPSSLLMRCLKVLDLIHRKREREREIEREREEKKIPSISA